MAGISIWQLAIIAMIVVLLFGTKKLSSLGSDLGASIKGFKKAMSSESDKQESSDASMQDADFPQQSLSEMQVDAEKDDTKRQHKAQV